jgi:hypothetical protein
MLTRIVLTKDGHNQGDVIRFEGNIYLIKFIDESPKLTRLYLEPITIREIN